MAGNVPFERIVALTDGVVAIAITLLVLPLADMGAEEPTAPIAKLLTENAATLGAFFLSFWVIYSYWRAHARIMSAPSASRPGAGMLNSIWLMLVVLVPLPTALMYRGSHPGAESFYLLITGGLGATTAVMTSRAASQATAEAAEWRHSARIAWAGVAVFGVAYLAAQWLGPNATWILLALIPIRRLGALWGRHSRASITDPSLPFQ